MTNKNGYPSGKTYQKIFGSWNNALIAANVDLNMYMYYTEEFLISELHRFVKENGRVPTYHEMRRKNGYPSYQAYDRYFGSWNNALIKANLIPNEIKHEYDGTESCSICHVCETSQWRYDNDDNIICAKCANKIYYEKNKEYYLKRWKIWKDNNPEKVKLINHRHNCECRTYGLLNINDPSHMCEGHHLWLENRSDFVIFFPEFLHTLYRHNHNKPNTMITPNAIALDFWINENFYKNLYFQI